MATLHFNTDLGRETSSRLGQCIAALEEELNSAHSSVNNLAGEWTAEGSTAFQSEFQDWVGQIRGNIDRLQDLQQRLDREIIQWETTAQSY